MYVGSIVRAPLSGRRIRGYVVEVDDGRPGLKELSSVSGSGPIFSKTLLESLQWAANHYVAPLSVVLDRAAPPNLPGGPLEPDGSPPPVGAGGLLDDVVVGAGARRRHPAVALAGRFEPMAWMGSLARVLAAGDSAAIIVSTTAEAGILHAEAEGLFGDRVILASGSDRDITRAWDAAQTAGRLVIGTPRIAAWSISDLAVCVVVEEGRRAMKDRQTPTIHVRDLILTRARLEGFTPIFVGPTPSVEVLAAGAEIVRSGSRCWALAEVVDRRDEAPGSGYVSSRAVAALRAVSEIGGRSFVFTHRRVSEASSRCSSCRSIRRCSRCGSNAGREPGCRRCGWVLGPCASCGADRFEPMGTIPEQLAAAVNRSLGPGMAGVAPTSLPVSVGTERDLATTARYDLVVVSDVDGLVFGQNYRAGEEALRILARLGNLVSVGSGKRMMLQTSVPDGRLVATMRSGDPIGYLEETLVERAREQLPPSVDMMALELRGEIDPGEIAASLGSAGAPGLMGPATSQGTHRWLIQGDLGRFRLELRSLVRNWRDRDIVVRIDADPIDL